MISSVVNTPIAIIMGSKSDWKTMKIAEQILIELKVSCNIEIISAHRTPDKLFTFAERAMQNGLKVIIAGAGGAAHLPGMLASKTILPVLGVPIQTSTLGGIDSLYSIVQMPKGIPVGTLSIGNSGAANAALLAVQILALEDNSLVSRLLQWRHQQTYEVLQNSDPRDYI